MPQKLRSTRALPRAAAVLFVASIGALLLSQLRAIDALSVAGLTISFALLYLARRLAGTRLALVYLVPLLWCLYFPVRLVVVELDHANPAFRPVVATATAKDFEWVWVATLIGLTAFVAGAAVVRRFHIADRCGTVALSAAHYRVLAVLGATVTALLIYGHVSNGFLTNVGPLLYFGLGGLVYVEHGKIRPLTAFLLIIGIILGVASGFKQEALFPIIAVFAGMVAGGRRISRPVAVVLVGLALMMYLGIEAQRMAPLSGRSRPEVVVGALTAAQSYDLSTGAPLPKKAKGLGIARNIMFGLSHRINGVTSLLILHRDVPSLRPYLRGQSIIEPALSVLPGTTSLLRPEFRSLSLGRYFDQRFYSADPAADPSSQAITWPGDLFLNFGIAGIGIGMFCIGLLLAAYDKACPTSSDLGVALFSYVGIVFLGVEQNVAYVFVTALLRLCLAALLVGVFKLTKNETRGRPAHL